MIQCIKDEANRLSDKEFAMLLPEERRIGLSAHSLGSNSVPERLFDQVVKYIPDDTQAILGNPDF